jgi:phage terminase large subunit
LRKGNWVAAEGIVFEDWNPAVHLVDPFPIPDGWRTWWAIDFGYTNPFVWQCWREDPDGNLYLEKEIYRTQTLVTDHCKEIMRLSATVRDGQQVVRRPEAIITDHDAEDRATLERAVGWSTRAAQKTVLDGIEAVQLRIKRKRIFILKDACQRRDQSLIDAKKPTCTAEEIPGYIWFESSVKAGIGVRKEGPVKENDHGCDAMRYVVAHRDLQFAPRVRWA